jgi:aspartokinase
MSFQDETKWAVSQIRSRSEIKVSVAIELAKGEEAMRAVHQAFLGN